MINNQVIPVILAGGSGTRLWPLSTPTYPKQFLAIKNQMSIFEQTIDRAYSIYKEYPLVICNEEHKFIIQEKLENQKLLKNNIIVEPCAKNTAPAIALAAFYYQLKNEDPYLLVMPSDHFIENIDSFKKSIDIAISQNENQNKQILLFGINQDKPNIHYGYIEKKNIITNNIFKVNRFIEKPSLSIANQLFNNKNYLFNTGIFLIKCSTYLIELNKSNKLVYDLCYESILGKTVYKDFIYVDKNKFNQCPSISIDYAIMENSSNIVVAEINTKWKDLGNFNLVYEHLDKDINNNCIIGDVLAYQSKNNLIISETSFVATLGLENHLVVNTKDMLLIAPLDKSDRLSELIEQIKNLNRKELLENNEVYKPWGKYEIIKKIGSYKIKHIIIKPGQKISTQQHKYREEHWIITQGEGIVTLNFQLFNVKPNDRISIEKDIIHCIENNSSEKELHFIEIQNGDYLEEDDIIRHEDRYNRI